MIADNEVYKIGHIGRTHGVKGEVTFSFTDDVWDRAEAAYLLLRVEGILVPFFLEEYRFRSDTTALLKFLDYDSANDVQFLPALADARGKRGRRIHLALLHGLRALGRGGGTHRHHRPRG